MTYPAAPAAMITVRRPVEITYAARSYKIFVNGVKVETVGVRQTLDIPVVPGRHVLKAKIDWCGSRDLVLDVFPGQRVIIDVRAGGMFYEKLFNQIFRPGQFLALTPVEG
jgi:hypothetical protein